MRLTELTEAKLPLGQPANTTGLTFGFEAEFVVTGDWQQRNAHPAQIEDLSDLEHLCTIDPANLKKALTNFRRRTKDRDAGADDMLAALGVVDFLQKVGAELEDRVVIRDGEIIDLRMSDTDVHYLLVDVLCNDIGLCDINVFGSDHQHKKSLSRWYIEPDMTIDAGYSGNDVAAELTSPVMNEETFTEELRAVLGWIAGTEGIETNRTCGLHINIGLPANGANFDPVKLMTFAGEGFLKRLFPRASDSDTEALMPYLRSQAQFTQAFPELHKKLVQALEKKNDKQVLINIIPVLEGRGYVEFRAPGGAGYETRVDEILQHTHRFVRLLHIACTPGLYQQDYMRRLYLYLNGGRETPAGPGGGLSMAARAFLALARAVGLHKTAEFIQNDRLALSAEVFVNMLCAAAQRSVLPPPAQCRLMCHEAGITRSAIEDTIARIRRWGGHKEPGAEQAFEAALNAAIPG